MDYFISTIKQSACAPCLTASFTHILDLLTSRPPHLAAFQSLLHTQHFLTQKMPTELHMATAGKKIHLLPVRQSLSPHSGGL